MGTPSVIHRLAEYSINRVPDLALWIASDARILYGNEAACRSLGYLTPEMLTRTAFDLIPEMTPVLWSSLWKEIKQRESFTFEMSFRAREGRVFPAEITVHYVEFEGQGYACAFACDVTERQHLQKVKDEFISTVSHELRTPMTIIREGVSQVLEGLRGEINDSQRRGLGIALKGIDRLGRIIDELLDIAKIESGKVVLRQEQVDLGELLQEVCASFLPRAQAKGLVLRETVPGEKISIYIDRDRMTQVLTNLIGNAIKFTEQGQVTVSLIKRDAWVECEVADTGRGISEDDLSKVFTKFEQFGPAPGSEKGTGLGLSISKGIVELHQGTIRVESRVGVGSRFTFTLPVKTAQDFFRERLRDAVHASARRGADLSLVRFHLDSPEAVRRALGPEKASSVMREFEQLLRNKMSRKTDSVFASKTHLYLILPDTVKKEAQRVADRSQQALNRDLSEQHLGRVVFGTEVVSFPEDTPTEEAFLERTDGLAET